MGLPHRRKGAPDRRSGRRARQSGRPHRQSQRPAFRKTDSIGSKGSRFGRTVEARRIHAIGARTGRADDRLRVGKVRERAEEERFQETSLFLKVGFQGQACSNFPI